MYNTKFMRTVEFERIIPTFVGIITAAENIKIQQIETINSIFG